MTSRRSDALWSRDRRRKSESESAQVCFRHGFTVCKRVHNAGTLWAARNGQRAAWRRRGRAGFFSLSKCCQCGPKSGAGIKIGAPLQTPSLLLFLLPLTHHGQAPRDAPAGQGPRAQVPHNHIPVPHVRQPRTRPGQDGHGTLARVHHQRPKVSLCDLLQAVGESPSTLTPYPRPPQSIACLACSSRESGPMARSRAAQESPRV